MLKANYALNIASLCACRLRAIASLLHFQLTLGKVNTTIEFCHSDAVGGGRATAMQLRLLGKRSVTGVSVEDLGLLR